MLTFRHNSPTHFGGMVSQERDDEWSSGEDEPLDKIDEEILKTINDLHMRDDPMPNDLIEKTKRRLEKGQ